VFIAARRLTRGTDPEPDDESAEPEVILALTSTGALTVFADGFRAVRGIVAGDGVLYAATGGRRGAPGADGVVLQIPVLPGARAAWPRRQLRKTHDPGAGSAWSTVRDDPGARHRRPARRPRAREASPGWPGGPVRGRPRSSSGHGIRPGRSSLPRGWRVGSDS